MLVHSLLANSRVNGPGQRAVVWFQGCDLRCVGCWNPSSHRFDGRREKDIDEVGEWVLSCADIEGVTFSGGEPFQQASELYQLCEYVKVRRPSLSIAVFTGYTIIELSRGSWHWRARGADRWIQGNAELFTQIRTHLDFGVFGRYRQSVACNDKPLCGSRNQEVVFFTGRYSLADLEPQAYEVNISEDGTHAIITGFPPPTLVAESL